MDQGWSVCSSGIVWAMVRFMMKFMPVPAHAGLLPDRRGPGRNVAAQVKKRHPAFSRSQMESRGGPYV